jgi:hypothetical protein
MGEPSNHVSMTCVWLIQILFFLLQDERDQATLMATVECELAQQEREAALERRIRSEYEERIRDIMQAAGLA